MDGGGDNISWSPGRRRAGQSAEPEHGLAGHDHERHDGAHGAEGRADVAAAVAHQPFRRPDPDGRDGSSLTVTASASTDAESGLSGYAFPTAASWTVTGTAASRTYAWTPASTQPGTLGVHGVDLAGNSGPDASFTPTPDAAPPTTTDN